jgi:hypothetical protein
MTTCVEIGAELHRLADKVTEAAHSNEKSAFPVALANVRRFVRLCDESIYNMA